jgi:hypothetical protein
MDKIDSIFSSNQTKSTVYFLRFAMNSSSVAEIPISVTSKSGGRSAGPGWVREEKT